MHIVYDPDAICPIYAAVTPANINDITAAKVMPIEAGATYVFDLGYYDYCWWAKLHAADCRIVTRLKSNTKLRVVHKNAVAAGSNILSDRIGHLPQRMARNRKTRSRIPSRDRVRIDTGKILRISPMTSIYRQPTSPISINVVGRLSCSFVGSSRHSKSSSSLDAPKMPCAFRSQ